MFQDAGGNSATIDTANRWRNRFGLTFNVLADDNQKYYDMYRKGSLGQPLNLIIDRDLVITYKRFGHNHSEQENEIQRLLNK